MYEFSCFTLTILLYTAVLIPAAPLGPSSALHSRSQYCANAPHTKAGTFLPARTLSPPLHPRKSTSTVLWCAPHSSTYLILTTHPSTFPLALSSLLQTAFHIISTRISNLGDGLVLGGGYALDGEDGQALVTWNANNHQQTYGVLGAAVSALMDFMRQRGVVEAAFSIFDGGAEVGGGVLGGVGVMNMLFDEEGSE